MSDCTEPAIVERDLTAPPADVWDRVADPEQLAHWLDAAIDIGDGDDAPLQPGDEGTIRFREHDDDAVVLIEDVEPGHRLAFRWASPATAPTEVSITLSPIPDGTRIRIVERTLPFGTASRHVATSLAGRALLAVA